MEPIATGTSASLMGGLLSLGPFISSLTRSYLRRDGTFALVLSGVISGARSWDRDASGLTYLSLTAHRMLRQGRDRHQAIISTELMP